MRSPLAMLLCTMLVTGCLFPSFDEMQSGERVTNEDSPSADILAASASDAATVPSSNSSPDASALDAAVDAATKSKSAGAGRIACGSMQLDVKPGSYCCAAWGDNPDDNQDGWANQEEMCTFSQGHALFCDENADCAAGEVCCHVDREARCAKSCTGATAKILCTADARECPSGTGCKFPLDPQLPKNGFCQ